MCKDVKWYIGAKHLSSWEVSGHLCYRGDLGGR